MVQATAMNSTALTSVKMSAWRGEMRPDGMSRPAVRGFFASISRSTQRLNPIAALRANTMHPSSCSSRTQVNRAPGSRKASKKATSANGKAKTVCANFTSEPYCLIVGIIDICY